MSTQEYYQQKIAAGNAAVQRIQQKLNGMAFLRLLTFAGIVACIYFLAKQYSPFLLASAIGCIAAFIICINIYYRWKDDRRLQEKLVFVYTNELGLLSGALGFLGPAGVPLM